MAAQLANEADVKREIKKQLKAWGAWYTMPYQAGFSQAGVPDFLVCHRGRFLAVEAKFGSNRPTALQQRRLAEIEQAGGTALVINERNLEVLDLILNSKGVF